MPRQLKKISPHNDGVKREVHLTKLTNIAILPGGQGANPGATMTFYKSKDKPKGDSTMTDNSTKVAKEVAEKYRGDVADIPTSIDAEHQHGIRVVIEDGAVSLFCSYATGPDDEYGHYHTLTPNGDGSYSFLMDLGHTHDDITVEAIMEAVTGAVVKEADPNRLDILNKFHDNLSQLRDNNVEKEPTMAGETKKTAEDIQKESDARLAKLEAIASLSGVHKGHYDSLNEADRDTFLNKSAEDRDAAVEAATVEADSDDPIVYKMADGTVLRKSADPVLVALAKQNDTLAKTNVALVEKNAEQDLEKRVAELFPNLPGDNTAQKALLKSIDSIEDEAARAGAMAILTAKNKANEAAFGTVGTSEGVIKIESRKDANEKLDTLAKEYATKHAVDYYTAYEAVSKINTDLVKQAQSHTAA